MTYFKCKGCGITVDITDSPSTDEELCQSCLATKFNNAVDDLKLSQEDNFDEDLLDI